MAVVMMVMSRAARNSARHRAKMTREVSTFVRPASGSSAGGCCVGGPSTAGDVVDADADASSSFSTDEMPISLSPNPVPVSTPASTALSSPSVLCAASTVSSELIRPLGVVA